MDEFLATWEQPGQNQHLAFGALDPYKGKENSIVDLTANYSIPWTTFGVSAVNPADLSYTFVLGIETVAGGQFRLVTVAPNGHGTDVKLGKPCSDCTIQSVLHVNNVTQPVVLTMSPTTAGASQYTYSFVAWDLSTGTPTGAALASWKTAAYNTFATTAVSKDGVLYASDQFRGQGIKRFKDGQMTTLSTSGLLGYVCDLMYVDDDE